MVFIIGYVFGSFSKSRTLTVITRVAAILTIVLFISANILFFGLSRGHGHGPEHAPHGHCITEQR
ncbi:hypothetical protein GCM10009415_51310 [Chitinophaga japonensis]